MVMKGRGVRACRAWVGLAKKRAGAFNNNVMICGHETNRTVPRL